MSDAHRWENERFINVPLTLPNETKLRLVADRYFTTPQNVAGKILNDWLLGLDLSEVERIAKELLGNNATTIYEKNVRRREGDEGFRGF